jgi:hypothetical protein
MTTEQLRDIQRRTKDAVEAGEVEFGAHTWRTTGGAASDALEAAIASTKQPKCLWSGCKKPVAFRVVQRWNAKTVHVCADHVPGRGNVQPRGSEPKPNPTEPVTRGAYNIYPL